MPSSKHDSLDIKPIDLKEYSCKQSKHGHVPKVPLRMILLAPSGSGKTVLLSNLILNIYRGCFERIFVFSPSIDIDKTWEPVKKHQEDDMARICTPDCWRHEARTGCVALRACQGLSQ